MTKKEIFIGVGLGLALICACVLAFVLNGHTHNYEVVAPYTIEDNKAYENKKCSCGEVEKVELSNYVIVNPETAQQALDNAADGVTIVLNSGYYGKLYLRKNDASVSIPTNWAGGAENTTFKRTINGLTILGTEGTVVSSIHAEAATYPAGTKHSLSATYEYLNMYIDIKDFTVKNITFVPEENATAVSLAASGYKVSIDGLVIDGCTVEGANSSINNGNRLFISDDQKATVYKDKNGQEIMVGNRKNITISNCVMNNLHQGLKINFVENLTVKGNQFNAVKGRDLLIGGGSGVISGEIIIENNSSNGATERFMRMSGLSGNLTVKNNTITNNNGADKDILKVTANDGATFNFSGNNWEGQNDQEALADGVINYPQPAA